MKKDIKKMSDKELSEEIDNLYSEITEFNKRIIPKVTRLVELEIEQESKSNV